MTQYIITEERLVKLQGYFHNQDLVKFFEIINEVFDNPYNPQVEQEKVLGVTQVKILEDFRMLSFNATSQHMEAISLYHAQEIVKQRLGEFVRGEQ